MYPLKCKPIYKEMLWGGSLLAKKYARSLPSRQVGESWELTCRENGMTVIENGQFAGKTLSELIALKKEELLGTKIYNENDTVFPLLIKFIDANKDLSIQVHPDDAYAKKVEGELGKTEAWYIIDAKPGSKLVYGLKEGTTKEAFQKGIEENKVEELLHSVEVKAGDLIYIPAGTVHAIGEGLLICEIQQNSDTTYRVYDYNRKDASGNLRELHVEKALDVIDFSDAKQEIIRDGKVSCDYFDLQVIDIDTDKEVQLAADGSVFHVIIGIEGNVEIVTGEYRGGIKEGETFMIPANLGKYTLKGQGKVIFTSPK